jgi:hypothetical protein
MHGLEGLSDRVGVAAACAALQVPRASFYRWQAHTRRFCESRQDSHA